MKREVTCRLDGSDVIQTTKVLDDAGAIQSKNSVRLGDKTIVLSQVEAQVAEAKRDRDGIMSPKTSEPAPAADGAPGDENVFWISGKTLYKNTIRRNAAGKVVTESTSNEGDWKGKMANAEERLAELTTVRDAIAAAK